VILYRCLMSLFALVVLCARPHRKARLGFGAGPDWPAPHLWLHGASNGELASARPIIEELIAQAPEQHLLITANTDTGVALVQGWALPNVAARLAPLDLAWATRRFLRHWQVCGHISLESELWPHRFRLTQGPVLLLGARLSAGTAKGWGRLPKLAEATLARITWASAQDEDSLTRLGALGLGPAARGPVVDLKALYRAPAMPIPADLQGAFARDRTWLAASTHDGEEETVLAAHRLALRHDPDLRLILAPRHPKRADEITALIAAEGLSMARRSTGDTPGMAQVYLADTMGEMALWYQLAGRVLIGGTLCDRGGHTPYEPAAFGAALLHGPDVTNFRPAFGRLTAAAASRQIETAAQLAQALGDLSRPDAQQQAGAAAMQALRQEGDAAALAQTVLSQLDRP
jgi:3-deoxy-D-manno-octulosonic-acid transferase